MGRKQKAERCGLYHRREAPLYTSLTISHGGTGIRPSGGILKPQIPTCFTLHVHECQHFVVVGK